MGAAVGSETRVPRYAEVGRPGRPGWAAVPDGSRRPRAGRTCVARGERSEGLSNKRAPVSTGNAERHRERGPRSSSEASAGVHAAMTASSASACTSPGSVVRSTRQGRWGLECGVHADSIAFSWFSPSRRPADQPPAEPPGQHPRPQSRTVVGYPGRGRVVSATAMVPWAIAQSVWLPSASSRITSQRQTTRVRPGRTTWAWARSTAPRAGRR